MYSDPWDEVKGAYWFVGTLEARDGAKIPSDKVGDFVSALGRNYGIKAEKKDGVDVYNPRQRAAIRKLIGMKL